MKQTAKLPLPLIAVLCPVFSSTLSIALSRFRTGDFDEWESVAMFGAAIGVITFVVLLRADKISLRGS